MLDLLRGHYLVAILIDHFHKFPSPFEFYNGKGDLWVSAATGFVFLSGMLVAMVNLPKLADSGFGFVASRLFKRAFKLHVVGVVLTVVYSSLGLHFGTFPQIGEGIRFTTLWEVVVNALLFNYSYGWADLLIFYALLLSVSPLILYALYKGYWKYVFFVSFICWAYEFYSPGTLRISASFFPLLSWQFIFVLGSLVGYFRADFSKLYRTYFMGANTKFRVFLIIAFVSTLTLSYLDVFYGLFAGKTKEMLDLYFVKLELGPARLVVFFIWFTFFYWLFNVFYVSVSKYLGWLFFMYGKNSLLTYVLQSTVLFATFYIPLGGTYLSNTFWTICVILLVWAMVLVCRTRYFAWLKL